MSPSANIPDNQLKRANSSNPHGWGLAARVDGGIAVSRGFSTDKLLAEMAHYRAKGATEVVFHARIATAGSINLKNTHPFTVTPDTLLFHNGILREVKCDIDKSMSDTWHYARTLEPILKVAPTILENEEFLAHVDAYAKKEASKFVIMEAGGKTIIFNEKAGVHRDGNWYSNHSAFEPLTWAGNYKALTTQSGEIEPFALWQARTNAALSKCDHNIDLHRFCKKCDRHRRRKTQHAEKLKAYGKFRPASTTQAARLRDERPKNAALLDSVHDIMYRSGMPIDAQIDALNSLPFGHED